MKSKVKRKELETQQKKQKMDFDTQPSSSSNVQVGMENQKPSTLEKVQDEQVKKKVQVSKPDTENQVEERSFLEELPPEMLMKILRNLDVKSLLFARLTNRKWNELARKIVKSRDDLEVVFYCSEIERTGIFKIHWKHGQATLNNFLEFFDGSEETKPYTRFRFSGFKTAVFKDPNWIQFVSDFGQTITCLKLVNCGEISDLLLFVGKLRHLLLNQLPNLQEFGLEPYVFYQYDDDATQSQIQLFPRTTTTSRKSPSAVQLPHLKVLHLDPSSFTEYTRIMTDLLGASVNLQKIVPTNSYRRFDDIESFQFLQSHGKLHCIQDTFIGLNNEFLSKLQQISFAPLDFKLKNLELDYDTTLENPLGRLIAAQFLSNLLQSSKNSLRELTMKPLGFLPDLKLAKFSKLTRFRLDRLEGSNATAFPSGTNLTETFPVLQDLELYVPWTEFFSHVEAVSSIPNLKTLLVLADGMTEKAIKWISQVCPNLREFVISEGNLGSLLWDLLPLQNFPEVGTAIWTHMKKLCSLNIDIDLNTPHNTFPNVDSCITGFSGDYCNRLYKLIKSKAGELSEQQGSHLNIPQSELDLEAERKNPSIMDLTDLKQLNIHLTGMSYFEMHRLMDKLNEDDTEGEQMSESDKQLEQEMKMKAITLVSEEFALKLMTTLTYKIHGYY